MSFGKFVMEFPMTRMTNNRKVLDSVVVPIPVDMMHIKILCGSAHATPIRVARESQFPKNASAIGRVFHSKIPLPAGCGTKPRSVNSPLPVQISLSLVGLLTQGAGKSQHNDRTFTIRHFTSITSQVGHRKGDGV